ncbi:MAG: VOC family protein, partial [Gemmatimonadota bacterium]
WLGYVAVPNVDATIEQAVKLGGSVVMSPMDIPMVGRSAVIADPQGAAIGIFTPVGDAPGHEGAPNTGEFSWNELFTTDYTAASKFYSDLFGWEKGQAMDMGEGLGIYQLFRRNGRDVGGMFNKPDPNMPSMWCYYVRVPEMAAAQQRITSGGGTVVNGPMEVPGGDTILMATDPQGAMFAVHYVKNPA